MGSNSDREKGYVAVIRAANIREAIVMAFRSFINVIASYEPNNDYHDMLMEFTDSHTVIHVGEIRHYQCALKKYITNVMIEDVSKNLVLTNDIVIIDEYAGNQYAVTFDTDVCVEDKAEGTIKYSSGWVFWGPKAWIKDYQTLNVVTVRLI